MSNSLLFSKVALQFFHGSDHRPVLTSLDLDPPRKTWKPERNWKTLDSNLARSECEKLQLLFHFQNKYEVDEYLEYLDNFLQEIASKYTPLQKQSGHSVFWWNQEIQNKVKKKRRLRRKVQKGKQVKRNLSKQPSLRKKQSEIESRIFSDTKSMNWPALQSSGNLQSGESPKLTRFLIFLWFLIWKLKKE